LDLPQRERESCQVTLRWYLSWCHRLGVGCTVQSAQDFIDWAREEKQANDWMVERWREPFALCSKSFGSASSSMDTSFIQFVSIILKCK
jgi:hypothetical protein